MGPLFVHEFRDALARLELSQAAFWGRFALLPGFEHIGAMARNGGRPARFTQAERAEVLRRAQAGESKRKIAEAVFGDARYRGRVERIMRAETIDPARSGPELPPLELKLDHTAPPADARYWRELVSHSRRSLGQRLAQGEAVPARELATLLKFEQQVANQEQFERLRDLTREGTG